MNGAALGDGVACVADSDGLRLVAVTDAYRPHSMAAVDPYGATPWAADAFLSVQVAEDIAYVAFDPGCSGWCTGQRLAL